MSEYILGADAPPVVYGEKDLDAPFWEAARNHELKIQRCQDCGKFQWGPNVICHHCHSFNLGFDKVSPTGTIYSWERVWHPHMPALADKVPYVILVVALDDDPQIRLVGNLVGDQQAPVPIGAKVEAVFEDHPDYTLIQWKLV